LFILLTIAGLVSFFAGAALDQKDIVYTQQKVGHGS
jgi:hypothetical protein